MRKILMLSFIFVFSFISIAQIMGPKISFEELTYDFGNIPSGPGVYHDFKLTNTGDFPLEIQRIKPSCGCTAVKPEKDRIAPNESTNIRVNFSTLGRSGDQKKYVYVFSNDTENPEIRLVFTANIIDQKPDTNGPSISLSRNIFNLGEIKEGQVYDVEVEISNDGKKELSIKKIKSSCGCTSTKLEKQLLAPGEKVTLKIELNTEGRTGKWTRTITITSNDPVKPEEVITLICDVKERQS